MRRSAGRHFYLLCALPGLGDFESPPPIHKQELLALVTESAGPVAVVRALLLSDDLLQREAALAGEREPDPAELTVFSTQQAMGEAPLPDFLEPGQHDAGESSSPSIMVDPIWDNFFHYVSEVARRSRTRFLRAWVGFEVGLRNALVRARAEALELDPVPYMVARGLAARELPWEGILAEWSAASNPLEALEALDRARWAWVSAHDSWYSFRDDEVGAYTVKVMILHRWRRIRSGGTN